MDARSCASATTSRNVASIAATSGLIGPDPVTVQVVERIAGVVGGHDSDAGGHGLLHGQGKAFGNRAGSTNTSQAR